MTNPTDTNQASELYELCKEVYERTGWRDTPGYIQPFGQNVNFPNWFDETITKDHDIAPLYTSDYLLEKLPRTVRFYGDPASMSGSGYSYLSIERPVASNWCASYRYEGYPMHCGFGDTPLKALLRLTIALSEAGELK